MAVAIKLHWRKDSTRSNSRLKTQPAHTTRKNLKKGFLSLLEVSAFSRLEVDLRSKLEKLRIVSRMPSALLELRLRKVLLLVEVVLCCMLPELWIL